MKFYTLLHIARNETSTHNNKAKSFDAQMQIYIDCINLLRKSLQNQGFELAVLTNDKSYLSGLFAGSSIEIIELTFTMNVPSGVTFYSAHYKNEVYKYFAGLDEDYVALIDTDIICINEMPLSFRNCIRNGIALYYDISNQIHPVFGVDVVLRDKKMVDENAQTGLWAGGEFIAGPPHFFKKLYEQMEEFSPAYFANIRSFHHQSDEFLSSVAIESGRLKNLYTLIDGGVLNIIGRYWNYPTIHSQPALDTFQYCFLLHLPANKKLMAGLDINTFPAKNVFSFLRPKLRFLYLINSMKSRVQKLAASRKQ